MAQPQAWQSGTVYVNYATQHPASPFPPASLDSDFANLRITLDEVLANLELIQRDDGNLQNGCVTPDSLSTATKNLIGDWNPRGAWVTATLYAVRDMVTVSDVSYVCAVAHLSGVFATNLAQGYWQPVGGDSASPGSDITIGDPVVDGVEGDVLFVGPGGLLAQNDFFHFDTLNYRLGIGESSPQQPLHVVGNIRLDGVGNTMGFYFGTTASSSDSALIQFRDAQVYGFGSGAVVAGLGSSNASWGWTENGIVLNTGARLDFGASNIQADLTAAASLLVDSAGNFGWGVGPFASASGAADNIAIGDSALFAVTSGDENVAVGVDALRGCTTGSDNSAFGAVALHDLTTGSKNIGIGLRGGAAITTGSENIAIGWQALSGVSTITGSRNVAIGTDSLAHQAAFNDGVAVGWSAANNTTGDGTVAIGSQALFLPGGIANTAVGYQALMGTSVGSAADGNAAFGYQAGSAITTGDFNLFLGYLSGAAVTTGSNNILIGAGTDAAATANNQIAIGAAVVCTAANQTRIGNNSTTTAFITGALTLPDLAGTTGTIPFTDNAGKLAINSGFTFNNGNALNLAETVVGGVFINSQNNDTTAASYAAITANVGNSSIGNRAVYGGDAFTRYIVSGTGAADYALGYDRSATVFALSKNTDPGTNNVFTADGTTFEVVDVLKINNTAQADAAAVSTHTVNINVGGVDYKFLVKT